MSVRTWQRFLRARNDVIAEREANRHKRGYDDDWTIEQLARIVAFETPRVGTWIDSSDLTPEETAYAILDA